MGQRMVRGIQLVLDLLGLLQLLGIQRIPLVLDLRVHRSLLGFHVGLEHQLVQQVQQVHQVLLHLDHLVARRFLLVLVDLCGLQHPVVLCILGIQYLQELLGLLVVLEFLLVPRVRVVLVLQEHRLHLDLLLLREVLVVLGLPLHLVVLLVLLLLPFLAHLVLLVHPVFL